MYIKTFCMHPLDVNSYLAWVDDGRAVVVDCGGQPGLLRDEIKTRGLLLTAVLLTHLHYDHVLGVAKLSRMTGAPIFASAADAVLAETGIGSGAVETPPTIPAFNFEDIGAGRVSFLGEPCLVLPVPGHTPGHVAYFFPKSLVVFTGDSLFCGSVGRTDGPGGDAALLLASIRSRLFALPDAVELFPGHGPSSTIGREKVENPFFVGKEPHIP